MFVTITGRLLTVSTKKMYIRINDVIGGTRRDAARPTAVSEKSTDSRVEGNRLNTESQFRSFYGVIIIIILAWPVPN